MDIIDENDEIPTFTEREYQTSIEENNPINVTVITLSATDGYGIIQNIEFLVLFHFDPC